jgi:hypothetical protein
MYKDPPKGFFKTLQPMGLMSAPGAGERGRPAGLPLGLLANVTYDRLVINPLSDQSASWRRFPALQRWRLRSEWSG